MQSLVRVKWLDHRKGDICGNRYVWNWGRLEKRQLKNNGDLRIPEWMEYPSNNALDQDLNCMMKIKYKFERDYVYEKLSDIGYQCPYTLYKFLENRDLMNPKMDQWKQRNLVLNAPYYEIGDILYLKDVDKNRVKNRIVKVMKFYEDKRYIYPFMDGAAPRYQVKHIKYDFDNGVQLLQQLDNGWRLYNNGYGYVCDDDVHFICKSDIFAPYNIRIFEQEKQLQKLKYHCRISAEHHIDSILAQLQKWLSIRYVNSERHIRTTLHPNQKKNEFDPLLQSKGYDFDNNLDMNKAKTQQFYSFSYRDLKQVYGSDIIKTINNGSDRATYSIVIYEMELTFYIGHKINNLKIWADIRRINV